MFGSFGRTAVWPVLHSPRFRHYSGTTRRIRPAVREYSRRRVRYKSFLRYSLTLASFPEFLVEVCPLSFGIFFKKIFTLNTFGYTIFLKNYG